MRYYAKPLIFIIISAQLNVSLAQYLGIKTLLFLTKPKGYGCYPTPKYTQTSTGRMGGGIKSVWALQKCPCECPEQENVIKGTEEVIQGKSQNTQHGNILSMVAH